MKAFLKTLFGDVNNVAVVALLVAIAFGLIGIRQPEIAVYVVPVLVMAGIVWLAQH
jgi:hypothetical protein